MFGSRVTSWFINLAITFFKVDSLEAILYEKEKLVQFCMAFLQSLTNFSIDNPVTASYKKRIKECLVQKFLVSLFTVFWRADLIWPAVIVWHGRFTQWHVRLRRKVFFKKKFQRETKIHTYFVKDEHRKRNWEEHTLWLLQGIPVNCYEVWTPVKWRSLQKSL